MKYLNEFHHSAKPVDKACSDMYILEAEIIELNSKPTVPVGELGVDAFLQSKTFVDRGIRRRALLAFGRPRMCRRITVCHATTLSLS